MSDGVSTAAVQTESSEAADTLLTGDPNPADNGGDNPAAAEGTGAEASGADSGGDDAGNAGAEGSQTPPDTYADFAMPEGVTIDAELLSEATPLFKELGLTQEQAQKLVDFQAKQVQAGSQKQVDAFNQQLDEWREQSENDKEFGGDKFDENVKVAQAAINKFGTPELKQLLNDYGVGNHPEVIRFMVRVGKLTAEDVPGGDNNPTTTQDDVLTRMYPNDRKS